MNHLAGPAGTRGNIYNISRSLISLNRIQRYRKAIEKCVSRSLVSIPTYIPNGVEDRGTTVRSVRMDKGLQEGDPAVVTSFGQSKLSASHVLKNGPFPL